MKPRARSGSRYRHDGAVACIDVRLRAAAQLFDGRDPAPFRERDLDPHAVEYLVGAVEEIPAREPLRVVLWILAPLPTELTPEVLQTAVREHFAHELGAVQRRLRRHLRRSQFTLLVAISVLIVFQALAEATSLLPPGTLRGVLREGLVITGWVALWRPLEAIFYDWWPLQDARRRLRRLVEAAVEVREGEEGPAA